MNYVHCSIVSGKKQAGLDVLNLGNNRYCKDLYLSFFIRILLRKFRARHPLRLQAVKPKYRHKIYLFIIYLFNLIIYL